jgi:16S rRNA processing protein RimM
VVADAATANPDRFLRFPRIELRFPDPEQAPLGVQVESVWAHQGRLVFKFRGVDSVEQAERLRDAELWIPRADRPPAPEGEYYFDELIGCEVVEQATGERLGKVTDCLETGGPLLLEVMAGDREILIPFVPEICVEKNVAARRIAVVLPEGLKDL